jgi:hypothetical protein
VIPNITKGKSFRGLMSYLVRQGRAHEEHTNPHIVGGHPSIIEFRDHEELRVMDALKVADTLSVPEKTYTGRGKGPTVWHCSLSLNPGEPPLSDQEWAEIAERFVAEMGFTGKPGLTDCRWVAVHHGLASGERDHIHIAVSLVRGPRRKASYKDDHKRAQARCRELERDYGLIELESAKHGSTTRGNNQGELARAKRAGAPETDRERLERLVRATAVKAGNEAEFVQLLRNDKRLLVGARFAAGSRQVVEGYSVALVPRKGEAKTWYGNAKKLKYGGRKLAHDLSLPQLRLKWAAASDQTVLSAAPDGERLEQDPMASAAATEWQAVNRGEVIAPAAVAAPRLDAATWERGTAELAELREHLRSIPEADDVARARVADAVAGVFYAWSDAAESTPGPLAAIGKSVTRSAQLRPGAVGGRRTSIPATRNAARLLAAVGRGGGASASEAARLRQLATQLANLIKALHDMHAAQGHAQRAAEMAETVMTRLAPVQAGLERAATQTAPQPDRDQAPEPAPRPPGAGSAPRPPRQPEQPER